MVTALPSLVALLEFRAQQTPDANAFVFLQDGQKDEVPVSYAQLAAQAKRIAGAIASVAAPGERVMIWT